MERAVGDIVDFYTPRNGGSDHRAIRRGRILDMYSLKEATRHKEAGTHYSVEKFEKDGSTYVEFHESSLCDEFIEIFMHYNPECSGKT